MDVLLLSIGYKFDDPSVTKTNVIFNKWVVKLVSSVASVPPYFTAFWVSWCHKQPGILPYYDIALISTLNWLKYIYWYIWIETYIYIIEFSHVYMQINEW